MYGETMKLYLHSVYAGCYISLMLCVPCITCTIFTTINQQNAPIYSLDICIISQYAYMFRSAREFC